MYISPIEVRIKIYDPYLLAKSQKLAKAKLNDLMTKVKIEAPSTIRLVRGKELGLVQ